MAESELWRDPQAAAELRQQMLRFAQLQLGDATLAEDAVQEAWLGALKNVGSFGARAALKSWMFAILKHKIADLLRQRQRVVEASQLLREGDEEQMMDALFDERGHWYRDERPATWEDPLASCESDGFWVVFEACLDHLPANQARVFMMREFIELESAEILTALELTTSNLNVMLHRARLRLRECLENRWFAADEEGAI